MFSIIIPTMQKDVEILNKLIFELDNSNLVDEILIIDNSTKGFLSNSKKVRVIVPKKNLFVNPAWNLGVREAKNEIVGIFNDDILLPLNFIEEVNNFIQKTPDFGIIGLDSNYMRNYEKKDFETYPNNSKLTFKPFDKTIYTEYFSSAFFIKKENYYEIPKNIKVWCGDNYLLKKNLDNNKTNYEIIGAEIKHLKSMTVGNKKFEKICEKDVYNYAKINPEFKKHSHYKGKRKTFLKTLFSLRNENKHKVLTITGIKIKIGKKQYCSKKYKKEYTDWLAKRNLEKSLEFVPYEKNEITNSNERLIAFYLPQFHTFKENDEWHGKGFSEWTNVTKAIPQFTGHNQPQLPIDVGFYDLSTDKVMYRQIELAKNYGIYGFCFHYYWFSGKRLMEKPIFNYLNNKELDLPFCLCFANENWSKNWDGGDKEVLIEQKFLEDDPKQFAQDIMPFFEDERYIKINNKPILVVYKPQLFKKEILKNFVYELNKKAKENGLDGVYLIMAKTQDAEINPKEFFMDAVVEFPPHIIDRYAKEVIKKTYLNPFFNARVFDMEEFIKNQEFLYETDYKLYKTVFPSWDNTARKAYTGASVFEISPELYKKWLKDCINWTKENNNKDEQFIFINAWNEWAEGAHLEPDQKYGYAYLQATKEALEESRKNEE